MELTPELIRLFAPTPIYTSVQGFAMWVLQHITPVLVIIAMWVRVTETQLGSFTGQSQWSAALKDFMWWGFILGVYFLLGALIANGLNAFYGMFDGQGSLATVFQQMETFITKMNAAEKAGKGAFSGAINVITAPFTLFSFGIYYLSLLFVTFIILFMRIAVAMGFGVVFIWGLIAIPMSMTSNYKLLRGWGMLAAGVAVWPLIESIFVALFAPVMASAAQGMFSGDATTFNLEKTGIYFIYTLLNILIAVIVIAAPIVTSLLVANNQALTGMVAPFVGGAFAATAATFKQSRAGMAMAAKGGVSKAASALSGFASSPAMSPGFGGSGGGGGGGGKSGSKSDMGPAKSRTAPAQANGKNDFVGPPKPASGSAQSSGLSGRNAAAATAMSSTMNDLASSTNNNGATAADNVQQDAPKRKVTRSPEKARKGHFINKSIKKQQVHNG